MAFGGSGGRWTSAGAAILLAACLVACGSDATEILVVVDSDLAVPGQIDGSRIEVTSPGATTPRVATADLTAQPLPRSLALVHEQGPLGPIEIVATGTRGGADVVERRAVVSFVEGRILVLRLDLLGDCVGTSCGADQTCGESGCRPVQIDPSELRAYPDGTGGLARDDAGPEGTDAGPGVDAGPRPDAGPPACPSGCDCTPMCTGGMPCTCDGCPCDIDCGGASSCDATCENDAACAIDAADASNVDIVCDAASCEVDCTDTSDCVVECRGGSSCLLRCGGSSNCEFNGCRGGAEQSCPGDIIVCRRDCP